MSKVNKEGIKTKLRFVVVVPLLLPLNIKCWDAFSKTAIEMWGFILQEGA